MNKRPLLLSLLAVTAVLFGVAAAQDAGTPATPTPAAPPANPIALRSEIYIVSLVTLDDGSREERFTAATSAIPGQVIEYRIFATNTGETTLPAGRVQVLGPVQEGMEFVAGSATPSSERVLTEFSADGSQFGVPPILVGTGDSRRVVEPDEFKAVRWTLLVPMEPGQEEPFFYRVTLL
ncbi:MAG TPA: hypothetical protein VKZ43_05880 [Trueperaceae bacterium]|nr:hypothetical protein [Trueperaceae bacterium]